jgi:hypothetical protein
MGNAEQKKDKNADQYFFCHIRLKRGGGFPTPLNPHDRFLESCFTSFLPLSSIWDISFWRD